MFQFLLLNTLKMQVGGLDNTHFLPWQAFKVCCRSGRTYPFLILFRYSEGLFSVIFLKVWEKCAVSVNISFSEISRMDREVSSRYFFAILIRELIIYSFGEMPNWFLNSLKKYERLIASWVQIYSIVILLNMYLSIYCFPRIAGFLSGCG